MGSLEADPKTRLSVDWGGSPKRCQWRSEGGGALVSSPRMATSVLPALGSTVLTSGTCAPDLNLAGSVMGRTWPLAVAGMRSWDAPPPSPGHRGLAVSASTKGVSPPSSKAGQVGPLTMQHCRDERTRGAVTSRSRAGTKPPAPSRPAEHSLDDPGQPHWAAETLAESTHSRAQNRETQCQCHRKPGVWGGWWGAGRGWRCPGVSAGYTEGQILFGHLGSVRWWPLGGGRTCPGVV